MPEKRSSTPSRLTVDFTGVEVRGQSGAHVPEGDYLARVVGVTHQPKKDDETKFNLNWKLELVEPAKYKGKVIYYRTSLVKEYLWSLRSFLVDLLGESKVPKSTLDIPLAKIVTAKPLIGVTLEDDEYNSKVKSKVAGTFPKGDWESLKGEGEEDEAEDEEETEDEEEDEEEEAPAPAKKKKASEKTPKAAVTESDDDEDLEEIDMDDI